MNKRRFILGVLLTSIFSFGVFTACGNDDGGFFTPPPVTEKAYTLDKLDEAENIRIIEYPMRNVLGKTSQTNALVFTPKGPVPRGGYKMVVWAHGTLGVGDNCAPSKNILGENFKVAAKTLLEEGYVIVAPDYEGLGNEGIHPYLHLESESNSVLAAVNAMKITYSRDVHSDWMVLGQSQGGQAALGVAQYANEDPTFKGAVAGAPASSLGKIITEVAPAALSQIEMLENSQNVPLDKRSSVTSYATLLSYAALAGVGIKAYEPTFDYQSLFQERSKGFAKLVEGTNGDDGECLAGVREAFVKDIISYMQEAEGNKVMSYPGLDEEAFKNNTIVKEFLDKKSQPGTKQLDKPVLIIQGKLDTNVPAIVTAEMVTNLKKLGSPSIELILVEGAGHTDAIVKENQKLMDFVKKHLPLNK